MILGLDFNSDQAARIVERDGQIDGMAGDQRVVLTRLVIFKVHAPQTIGVGRTGFPIAPVLKRLFGRSNAR